MQQYNITNIPNGNYIVFMMASADSPSIFASTSKVYNLTFTYNNG